MHNVPHMKVGEIREQDVLGAVARGWCHPKNTHKEMDSDLASDIASEVYSLLMVGPPPDSREPKSGK